MQRHFQPIASLAIRGLSVVAGFALSFIIGHRFGPEANGIYALITQSGMFLSVIAVGGLDLAVVQKFSAAAALKTKIHSASVARVFASALGLAGLILVSLQIGGPTVLQWVVGSALPVGGLTILCLILVARAMTRISGAVLRAQRQYLLGQSVEVLIIPVVVLAVVAAGLAPDVLTILWATAITGIVVAGLGIAASMRGTARSDVAHDVPIRPLFKTALPLWGVAIALNIADWYALVVVANVAGVYDAGLYRLAIQMGSGFSIVSLGLYSVFAPQISAAFASSDRVSVAHLARTATRLSAVFIVPLALLLLILAEPLLYWVGPEFAAGTGMLRIVTIGQIIYTIIGPAGLVLAMSGHERASFAITMVSTVSLLIVAPFIADAYGAIGVASYVAVVQVGRNVASIIYVRRVIGISVMTGRVATEIDWPVQR